MCHGPHLVYSMRVGHLRNVFQPSAVYQHGFKHTSNSVDQWFPTRGPWTTGWEPLIYAITRMFKPMLVYCRRLENIP